MLKKICQSVTLLIFVFTIFYFAGCSNDTVNTVTPPENTPFLSGTIINYPGGSTIVKAMLFGGIPADSFTAGTDTVDNTAMLSMNVTTPPANFLDTISTSGLPSGIVISDTTARVTTLAYLSVYGFSNNFIANLQKRNFPDTVVTGSAITYYLYSSKAFSITGTDTNNTISDTTVITYNINFTSGWNAYSLKVLEKRPNFTRAEFSNGEVSGSSWYYMGIPSSDFRKEKFGLIF